MGFNNLGMDAMVKKLNGVRERDRLMGTIVGVNIGKNKDTPLEKAVDDYIVGIELFNGLADYLTLNISSPKHTRSEVYANGRSTGANARFCKGCSK